MTTALRPNDGIVTYPSRFVHHRRHHQEEEDEEEEDLMSSNDNWVPF